MLIRLLCISVLFLFLSMRFPFCSEVGLGLVFHPIPRWRSLSYPGNSTDGYAAVQNGNQLRIQSGRWRSHCQQIPGVQSPEGSFGWCLPQKVWGSAPVPKRNGPVGTVRGGKNGGLVVLLDKRVQTSPQFFQWMEIPHIKGCHPLILHGPEPSLDLGFSSRSVWLAVTECCTDPCSQEFHLFVLIRSPIVKAIPTSV